MSIQKTQTTEHALQNTLGTQVCSRTKRHGKSRWTRQQQTYHEPRTYVQTCGLVGDGELPVLGKFIVARKGRGERVGQARAIMTTRAGLLAALHTMLFVCIAGASPPNPYKAAPWCVLSQCMSYHQTSSRVIHAHTHKIITRCQTAHVTHLVTCQHFLLH